MKLFLATAVAFVLGLIAGSTMHRYEYVKTASDLYPARFDRWTGTTEITVFKMTDEVRRQLSSPKATPWGSGDEVVSPTPFDPDEYLKQQTTLPRASPR